MAAHAAKMVGVSEDSSSSDDEALRRCQEAVWVTQVTKTKDADRDVQQSKRIVVAEHEHDGNELQVTQGFRTHVAKKLGHFLDSCISELKTETSSCAESGKCDDEGFRLFSTSIPGQTVEEPPPPVRRRPIPSSSDSDSEMESRLREAAVSVKDLLPSMPSTHSTPSAEPPCSEKKKKKKKVAQEEEEEEETNVVVKKKKKKVTEGGKDSHVVKKKKRKHNEEESEEVDFAGSPPNAQSNGDHENSQEHNQAKVKRKKKKTLS
ncbi:protein CUSTOS [Scomber scombrus]|uniref:Protein CUSTOS n=1 Tax=Scomber scombrus TaxID=13677 RepID=A0AAV1MTR2_SCOSC